MRCRRAARPTGTGRQRKDSRGEKSRRSRLHREGARHARRATRDWPPSPVAEPLAIPPYAPALWHSLPDCHKARRPRRHSNFRVRRGFVFQATIPRDGRRAAFPPRSGKDSRKRRSAGCALARARSPLQAELRSNLLAPSPEETPRAEPSRRPPEHRGGYTGSSGPRASGPSAVARRGRAPAVLRSAVSILGDEALQRRESRPPSANSTASRRRTTPRRATGNRQKPSPEVSIEESRPRVETRLHVRAT